MTKWENMSPVEREKSIHCDYHRTERRIFNILDSLCDTFAYYKILRDELAGISIYGAEDYYSAGSNGENSAIMTNHSAAETYDF